MNGDRQLMSKDLPNVWLYVNTIVKLTKIMSTTKNQIKLAELSYGRATRRIATKNITKKTGACTPVRGHKHLLLEY